MKRNANATLAFIKGMVLSAIIKPADAVPAAARTMMCPGRQRSSDCGRAVLASLAARRGGSAEAAYRKLPDQPIRAAIRFRICGVTDRSEHRLSVAGPSGVVIARQLRGAARRSRPT